MFQLYFHANQVDQFAAGQQPHHPQPTKPIMAVKETNPTISEEPRIDQHYIRMSITTKYGKMFKNQPLWVVFLSKPWEFSGFINIILWQNTSSKKKKYHDFLCPQKISFLTKLTTSLSHSLVFSSFQIRDLFYQNITKLLQILSSNTRIVAWKLSH